MRQSIKEILDDELSVIIALRQQLHQHPEPGWQEFETTRRIVEFLQSRGITDIQRPLETGAIVNLQVNEQSPWLLLRADIDALPIQDTKQVAYRSRNPGYCHACGHDVHSAVVAGTAAVLWRLREALPVNVRFVFQPAEEPIPSGAMPMIEAGALQGIQYALGLHVEPRLPFQEIAITPGTVNLQSIRLEVHFQGPGGHSARPFDTADLITLAARFIQESTGIVHRELNGIQTPVILTYTEIEAGEGYNIIPKILRLIGTFRHGNPDTKEQFYRRLRDLKRYLEKQGSCRITIKTREGSPPVFNDPELVTILRRILTGYRDIPENLWTITVPPAGMTSDIIRSGYLPY